MINGLRRYHWWVSIGWLLIAAVILLSLVHIEQPIKMEDADKFEHLLAYGTLMYWWGMVQPAKRWTWALALPLLGLALEGAQSLTPDRMMEWRDALANLAGVLLGTVLLQTPARGLLPGLDRYLGNRFDTRGA